MNAEWGITRSARTGFRTWARLRAPSTGANPESVAGRTTKDASADQPAQAAGDGPIRTPEVIASATGGGPMLACAPERQGSGSFREGINQRETEQKETK